MTVREWMDSEPMRLARLGMFGNKKNSFCSSCYLSETRGPTSRRHRCNQKSAIFTRMNFSDSYSQSPGYDKFEHSRQNQGAYDGMPIDLHINLGNYCNLTCKMCDPESSSNIAVQYVKWDIKDAKQYVGTDWTNDRNIWQRTLEELADIENLSNVHFMGGETLITNRMEEFVDYMLQRGRTDIGLSFVTNGVIFNRDLMDKMTRFRRVGIEVSIETMTEHNGYQRQGTDTSEVLKNIDRYLAYCDGERVTLTARPTVTLLTIGYYPTLLEFCLEKNLVIRSLIFKSPEYYRPAILPEHIKNLYLEKYRDFLIRHDLTDEDVESDYNESDPHQVRKIIKTQVLECIETLKSPEPLDSRYQLSEFVRWCRRWDQIHGYDARRLYPEFREILDEHGY